MQEIFGLAIACVLSHDQFMSLERGGGVCGHDGAEYGSRVRVVVGGHDERHDSHRPPGLQPRAAKNSV